MIEGQGSPVAPGPGATCGRYRLLRKLGEGGMGVVFEAEHVDLRKRVALKTLRADLAGDAAVVERFVREGQAAARVRHPHVVDVTDVGTALGLPYLVMELLEGETLASRLARGPLEPSEAAALMLPVCAAVAAAHARGVLHRDLKPENVFLARAPHGAAHPKVLDFGIAKVLDDGLSLSLTTTAAVLGTPFYMSPEQARGERALDARSDQYALGVILYECVTGRRPFVADSLLALVAEITGGAPSPPRALRPELSEAFEAVVLRAMARDPSRRFASVRALGAALLPFADARTRSLWEGAFEPSRDDAPIPERPARVAPAGAAPTLVETAGGPRLHVGERVAPRPRRARPRWALAAAAVVLAGGTAWRLSSVRSPARAPRPDAALALDATPSHATPAAPVDPADGSVADASVSDASPADVAAPPSRRPAAGRRPAQVAPGRREIPME